MLFTKFLFAAAALTLASAQTVAFTNSDFSGIKVGVPFNITWSGASSGITLVLKNGPSSAQNIVMTIASGITGTSYSWVPASNLVSGTYNLEIDHGSDPPNYSAQFQISGGSVSSSGGSSASATGVTSSAASSALSASSTLTTSAALTSSAVSKANSTGTTTVGGTNTVASATTTVTRASGTSTSASTTVPAANNAAQYASPFAFVLLTFAAMAALN